jgi:hypothetical protein
MQEMLINNKTMPDTAHRARQTVPDRPNDGGHAAYMPRRRHRAM